MTNHEVVIPRILILALVAVASCGRRDITAPAGIVGFYRLTTLNGAALPATLPNGGGVQVIDDLYTLNTDQTYSEFRHLRQVYSSPAGSLFYTFFTGTDVGQYTTANGAVDLVSTAARGMINGTINGTTLTLIDQGGKMVYTKQ